MASYKTCRWCHKRKLVSFFWADPFMNDENDKLPICIDCCKKKLNKYEAEVKTKAGAIWLLCAEIGVPFYRDSWDDVMGKGKVALAESKANTVQDYFISYLRRARSMHPASKGFWQSNVMLPELIEQGKQDFKDQDVVKGVMDFHEEEIKWGKYEKKNRPDVEIYDFLNKKYAEYTEGLEEELTPYQINRYRDLCKAEWAKRKAEESGSIAEISKAQDNVMKIVKALKLDEVQKEDERSDTDRFIDRLIWQIEETEPAEDEDEAKYRDIAGFEKAFKNIMRSMQNLIAGTREYPDVPKEER